MDADSPVERIDNSVLRTEISMVRNGVGDPEALMDGLRRSVLFVPTTLDGAGLVADLEGLRWLYAFTSPAEMAAYFSAREEIGEPVDFVTVLGERLVDVVIPAMGTPAGIAVDVAGQEPIMFPLVDQTLAGAR